MKKGKLVSRRNIIVAAGAAAAVGALSLSPARRLIADAGGARSDGTAPGSGGPATLATGSLDDWQGAIGATFTIAGAGALRLAGLRPLESRGNRPSNLRGRAFVAMFDPVGGATLAGDLIYTARRRGAAAFPIFLSASPDPRTPARMLAVFN
jgi:hypothetical protein